MLLRVFLFIFIFLESLIIWFLKWSGNNELCFTLIWSQRFFHVQSTVFLGLHFGKSFLKIMGEISELLGTHKGLVSISNHSHRASPLLHLGYHDWAAFLNYFSSSVIISRCSESLLLRPESGSNPQHLSPWTLFILSAHHQATYSPESLEIWALTSSRALGPCEKPMSWIYWRKASLKTQRFQELNLERSEYVFIYVLKRNQNLFLSTFLWRVL